MKRILLLSCLFLLFVQSGFSQTGVWVTQATNLANNRGINSIEVVTDDIVWCGSFNGISPTTAVRDFCKTTNGGTTWTKGSISGAGLSIANISAIDSLKAFALLNPSTTGGKLMSTTNGGQAWNVVTSAAYDVNASFANIVHAFDANNVMSMGDPRNGYFEIYRSTDGGTSFTRVPQSDIAPILTGEFGLVNSFGSYGDNHLWFGTNKNRVYKTRDGGATYQAYTVTEISDAWIVDFAFSDTLNGICLASDGSSIQYGTYKTTDGGETWTKLINGGDPYGTIITSVSGMAYDECGMRFWVAGAATGSSGTAYSEDGGTTWTTVDSIDQHTSIAFGINVGYSGNFSDGTSGTRGIFKWTCTTTGIDNNLNQEEAISQGYPNPVRSLYRYQSPFLKHANVVLTVYDLTGKELEQKVYNNISGHIIEDFDFSDHASGVYLLNININGKQFSQKILKN